MNDKRIARVLGIDIIIDWSWIVIFLLMTWNVLIVFYGWHPSWGFLQSLALAALTSLLFFGSVLLHELGHAVVALSLGMKVKSIRLFLFGGVSNIDREPPSPRGELLMAMMGPIVSFGIGFTILVSATRMFSGADLLEEMPRMGPVLTILCWLGPANLLVGAFNLIPAFPLDGGRVFRAILWGLTGDFSRATAWASSIGQLIGWTFIVGGIAAFLGVRVPLIGSMAGGLWFALIGWFMVNAARQSQTNARIQDACAGIKVQSLMRRAGPNVPFNASVAELVDRFVELGDHAFLVLDGEACVGLVSTDDVRKVSREDRAATSVGAIMTPVSKLVVTAPSDEILSALRRLDEARVEQLPVVENGVIVGIFERRRLVRWLEERLAAQDARVPHLAR